MKPKATEESGKQNPSTGEPAQTASLGFGMTPGDAKRYHGEIDLSNLDHPRTQLILLTGQNKRVLEIGPSTGYISQALQQRGCTVTGLEIDPVAAEEAAQFCERMIVADAEKIDLASTFQDQKFDVVMLGDVLEHMVDPLSVLVAVRSLLRPKGYAVVSIPNMAHGSIRLRLLNGEFRYRDTGLLDITHLRFFTAETLEELLHDAGYRITTWKRILLDPCDAELGVKDKNYPAYLMQAIRGDIEAMTYQFVVQAEPVPLPTPKRAGKNQHSQTAESQERQVAPPALPAEPVAASLLLVERELGDKTRHIANLKDALAAKDQHIANLKDALAKKDTLLAEKDTLLAQKQTALDETEEQLREVRQQFQVTTSALGYRMLARTRAVINRLAPPETRRRGALKFPRKGLRIILTEGWGTFLRRAVRVWRWGPRMIRPTRVAAQEGSLDEQYQLWLREHALTPARIRRIRKDAAQLSYRPKVSIITPVYNPDPAWLRDAIESVRAQLYDNWELCIADDASKGRAVRALLKEYRAEERIKVTHMKKNKGISGASNVALAMATGEYVGFLDHDDELKPDALYEVVKLLNEQPDLDFIYSDEDKRTPDGRLVQPFFKPDWSPDLLLSTNYVPHFAVYRKRLVDEVGGLRSKCDYSQDYDLVLRVTELTDRIGHVALPLYAWRMVPGSAAARLDAKPKSIDAAKRALADAMQRRGTDAEVVEGPFSNTFRVRYHIDGQPLVSIVIPTRDRLDLLSQCIKSIEKKTSYPNYEIVIVDNDSQEEATHRYLKKSKHKCLPYPGEFLYGAMMNFAMRAVAGDYVVLLNNDTEVISEDWIEAMLEHAQRPEVAGVGVRLLYPNATPQHEGVVIGVGGGSCLNVDTRDYFGLGRLVRNVSAVTAACMMIRRQMLEEMDYFDEGLKVAFHDVDYCLRAREKGYLIVYTPYAVLLHDESSSRGTYHPPEDELFYRNRWGNPGEYRDPYYNPNLDVIHPFTIGF